MGSSPICRTNKNDHPNGWSFFVGKTIEGLEATAAAFRGGENAAVSAF